jgi:hypothetical protein
MEVKVSDPAFVYDLVCSLKRAAYVATALDSNTVLVRAPESSTIEQARTQSRFLSRELALAPPRRRCRSSGAAVIIEIDAPREQAARRRVELYVAAWQARKPGMRARLKPRYDV